MDELHQSLVDTLNIGLILLDSQQRILIWNQWLVDYTGKSKDAVKGEYLYQLYPLFQQEIYQGFFEKCLTEYQGVFCSSSLHPLFFPPVPERKARQNLQIQYLSHQGEGAILLQIFDVTRQEEKIQLLHREIGERKKVEEALQKNQEQLRQITNNMQDMVSRIDENGIMTYVSPSYQRILGFSPQHLMGEPFYQYVHPGDKGRILQQLDRLKNLGQSIQVEYRHLTVEGTPMWVESTGQAIMQQGRMQGAILTTRDISQRKQMEEILRQSKETLDSILDSLHDGIWSMEADTGEYLFLNEAMETIYRIPRDELREDASRWQQQIHPEDRSQVLDRMEKVIEERSQDLEYRLLGPAGEIRWIRDRSRVILDEEKRPIRIDGILTDITAAKGAEAELKANTRLLEGVLNGISDVIAVQRPDHTIERYNRAGYQLLNLSPEEVQGRPCFALLGQEQECLECATQEAVKSKRLASMEKYIPQLDSYFNCRSNPILDEDGNVLLIVEQLRDITTQKKLEEEIRRSEEYVRSIISLIPDLLVTFSAEGEYLEIWAKDGEHFSLPQQDLLGKKVQEVFSRELAACFLQYIQEALTTRKLQTFEYTFTKKERMEFEARFMARSHDQVLAIIRDITERKKQERALEQEMERARELQESLLPSQLPLIPGGVLAASHQQASHVSGDYYDLRLSQGGLYLLMADVTGHGFDASLVTVFVSSFFRRELANLRSPCSPYTLLQKLHRDFLQQGFSDDYSIEVFLGRCDLSCMELQYAVSGVIRSLLCDDTGQITVLPDNHGMIINNIIKTPHFGQGRITIRPGQSLLIYTDGIDEPFLTRDIQGKPWVEEIGRQASGLLSLEDLLERIIGDTTYMYQDSLVDDMTIIGLSSHHPDLKKREWLCPRDMKSLVPQTQEIIHFLQRSLPIDADMVSMALFEALSNAVDHGVGAPKIPVVAFWTPRQLCICVTSPGSCFDWRKTLASLQDMHGSSERGRGLGLIQLATHRFAFNESGDRITLAWDLLPPSP